MASSSWYSSLVLGARGCGAFGIDATEAAQAFRNALEKDFAGHFEEVVFAVSDLSQYRRFLGPFRNVFVESERPTV